MSDTIVVVIDKKTGATQVHDTDTQTATTSTGATVPYNSDLAQMFGHPATTDDKGAWWNKPQDSKNERTKIAIKDGQQVSIAWPSTQSVTELTRSTAPVNIALNSVVPADQPIGGRIFVKLAGSSSGAIQGAIAVGGRQVGDGNLDSAMLEMAVADKTGWNGDMYGVKPGDTLSVSVRIDGGDPTVLYQLSVPGK